MQFVFDVQRCHAGVSVLGEHRCGQLVVITDGAAAAGCAAQAIEVKGVSRVVYDITGKPPATI